MKIVVFDTETTGLPVKGDILLPDQPWVVQMGAVLLEDFEQTRTLNALVCPPEGIVFHERAVATHGLSEELCRSEGRPIKDVFAEFRDLCDGIDMIAAYNLAFDDQIMRSCSLRLDPDSYSEKPIYPANAQRHCIMNHATNFLRGRRKLEQAYLQLLGKPLTDAHDAFADTLAAVEVFKALIAKTMVN